jgi:predicted CXXCH cytochrome family protein
VPLANLAPIILAAALLLGSAAGAAASGCVTAACHPQLAKGRGVHAPVAEGDCASCHQPTAKRHPGAGSMTLVAAGRELCLNCHADPLTKQTYTHAPVSDGCLDCHDPHRSAHKKLLLKAGGQLCLDCHAEVVAGKQVHGPVRAGNCALCHLPHASADKGLLSQPGNDVCLNCHVGIKNIIANAVSQHDPVAHGRCWECHAPHAADYPPLLRAYYPTQLYTPYRTGHYALCFSCHDKSAMEFERTSAATAFRNRDQNLHHLHVNRADKGRTCRVCHGVHGADQPALLRSSMHNFGKWDIPMRWVETDGGATCYVGCHGPKEYNRVIRVKNR